LTDSDLALPFLETPALKAICGTGWMSTDWLVAFWSPAASVTARVTGNEVAEVPGV
jgi:hypothetical protein